MMDDDFIEGYLDGRDPNTPNPGENRSKAYLHSFNVGRVEINGTVIPAHVSRKAAQKIIEEAGEHLK